MATPRLAPMPLYEHIDSIKPITALLKLPLEIQHNIVICQVPRTKYTTKIFFNMDIQNILRIFFNGIPFNWSSGSADISPVQVIIRFFKWDLRNEVNDHYPPNLSLTLNGKLVDGRLPTQMPSHRPDVDSRRPGRPINLTPDILLNSAKNNSLMISWTTPCPKLMEVDGGEFGFCILLVQRLTVDELVARVTARPLFPLSATYQMIRNSLLPRHDDMTAVERLTVGLLDLVTRRRIEMPARGQNCAHPQCFDLRSFIDMNDRTPKWVCPVCNKPILLQNVRIDSFFLELLDAYPAPVEDVTFTSDGIEAFKKLIQRAVILEGSQREQVPGFDCVALAPTVGEGDFAAIGAPTTRRRGAASTANNAAVKSSPTVTATVIEDIDSPEK